MGDYLHSIIPGSRLKLLPDEGHMLYLTHWADVLRDLTT
jgi:pimeloyl-ACP methyl ester carboxylesterase